jgi:hypothetical protein
MHEPTSVGDNDGDSDGFSDGEREGSAVGDRLGESVGRRVGEPVGLLLGDTLGDVDGSRVGVRVGTPVGLAVGANVSSQHAKMTPPRAGQHMWYASVAYPASTHRGFRAHVAHVASVSCTSASSDRDSRWARSAERTHKASLCRTVTLCCVSLWPTDVMFGRPTDRSSGFCVTTSGPGNTPRNCSRPVVDVSAALL